MAERDLCAAWLSPSCLAVCGNLDTSQPQVSSGARIELGPGQHLALRAGEHTRSLGEVELARITTDVADLVRRRLAPLDAAARTRVTDFLATATEMVPAAERHEVSERLHGIRAALRERLPVVTPDPARRRGIGIDRLMSIDQTTFFVEGWQHFEDADLISFIAVSPEGARVDLLAGMARLPRPDVAETLGLTTHRLRERIGFLCLVDLRAPSLQRDGWLLEFEDAQGERGEIAAPAVVTEAIDVREALLDDPDLDKLASETVMRDHVQPAISRLQERLGSSNEIESVVQHGTPPDSPEVTIVVPVYRQLEHVEVQLSQFADDPDIGGADLIYVLDSPEDAPAFRRYTAELQPIYGVPFRTAIMVANAGFAGACNAGASLARGRLLLLLNSDVLPAEPGWLSLMCGFYDSTPGIGALGPKLLYEDDSIQHAGMHFVRFSDPGLRLWIDSTYFKGMHSSLPAANIARPVPAVSGACMLVDRGLWEQVGGLPGIYVRGDYEDTHFCLELLEREHQNWYLPQAQLYHLEGQSYTSELRGPANRFNSWVHSRTWGDRIGAIADRAQCSSAARGM